MTAPTADETVNLFVSSTRAHRAWRYRSSVPAAMSAEELETIIERCLVDSGIWSARRSDGVTALRLIIAEVAHTRAWFQVYDIDQSLHVGCLDMQRDDNTWRWTLHLQPEEWAEAARAFSPRESCATLMPCSTIRRRSFGYMSHKERSCPVPENEGPPARSLDAIRKHSPL